MKLKTKINICIGLVWAGAILTVLSRKLGDWSLWVGLAIFVGATLLRCSALPENTIVGLDKRYALEMVESGGVIVEYDKLIDRQLERAAITATAGFAPMFSEAVWMLGV